MVDFFEFDMSPKPVFFRKIKTIFSEMQNLLKVASRTAKVLQTPKVAQKLPSTIGTGLVHGVVYCGYSVTHLLSNSCCYDLEIICNHCKL